MVKKTLSAIIAVLLAAAVLASCAKAEKASSAQKQTKSETSPIPQAVTVPQETNSVEQVLASMTTEEKIEQMIMPSIRYNDNGDREYVTKITDDIRRSLKKHSYAGVASSDGRFAEGERRKGRLPSASHRNRPGGRHGVASRSGHDDARQYDARRD